MAKKFKFYNKRLNAKINDFLLIPFGEKKPSRFKIVSLNKKQNQLTVEVIEDTYSGEDEKYKPGQIVNIGKMIYEGYWCFKVERAL